MLVNKNNKIKQIKVAATRLSQNKKIFWPVMAVVLLLIIFGAYKLFNFYQNQRIISTLTGTKNMTTNKIIEDTKLAQVDTLFQLPKDESALVGKVKNAEDLSNANSVFKKASNGDIVIIYPNWVVTYDPVNKTIVDISKTKVLH